MKSMTKPYNSVFAQVAYNMKLNTDPELFCEVMHLTKSFCTFCVKRNYFYNLLNTAILYPEDIVQEAIAFLLEWKCLPIEDQEEGNLIIEFVHRVQNILGIHTLHGGRRYTVLCYTDVNANVDVDVDSDVDVIDIVMLSQKDMSGDVDNTIEDIDVSVDAYNMQRMIENCTVFIRPYVTPSEYARLNKFIEGIDRKGDTQINSLATAIESRRKAVDKEIARGRTEKEVDIFIYYESQRAPIGALL